MTNALSSWLEAEVRHDGDVWAARYEKGIPVQSVTKERSLKKGERTGTTVRWLYDSSVFEPDVYYCFLSESGRSAKERISQPRLPARSLVTQL